ncbi:MAG: hypothetical protein ACXVXP_11560 [Mycobacteriaceae bacterium]
MDLNFEPQYGLDLCEGIDAWCTCPEALPETLPLIEVLVFDVLSPTDENWLGRVRMHWVGGVAGRYVLCLEERGKSNVVPHGDHDPDFLVTAATAWCAGHHAGYEGWRTEWRNERCLGDPEGAVIREALSSLPAELVPIGRRLVSHGWVGTPEDLGTICVMLASEK